MARKPRACPAGVAQHIVQRGNNRHVCFVTDEDRRFYLEWLGEYTEQAGCRVHSCEGGNAALMSLGEIDVGEDTEEEPA